MGVEGPKAVVGQWIDAWNRQDLDAAQDLLAPNYVRHDANIADIVGPQSQRLFIASVFDAFPDLHLHVKHLLGEADLVAARLTIRGTQQGDFLGVPATRREVSFESQELYRLMDGKIAEQWVLIDTWGLLQRLGAIPEPK